MTNDLVKRLRECRAGCGGGHTAGPCGTKLEREAADRIEALEREQGRSRSVRQ